MRPSIPWMLALLFLFSTVNDADAQEIRYSWLDMSYMGQDVGRQGTLPSPGVPNQLVDVAVTDGTGVRFRGSIGSWRGLYIVFDYGSTDIDLTGVVRNTVTGVEAPFDDEYDYTTIRGGIGFKYSIAFKTDLFGELTYDSLDFDFGSFAGENFDMDRQEPGATLGVRTLFGDDFQVQLQGRYSQVGDADLTTGIFDSDTLFGAGVAWQIIRGLFLVADYETGEFSSWSVGFRLDLDEE
jgi:hypothetical protein